ncbi:MAG: esterase/lipase family protein [Terriglobales bacterium]
MYQAVGSAPHRRVHIVLVPGFGAFDALGKVEYYSGITRLFQHWQPKDKSVPAVLHYFDNLPTAAVSIRAARLLQHLAKRFARGEMLEGDTLVLVGHSTGGLDIRQLVHDLHDPRHKFIPVDGGQKVAGQKLRKMLEAVVFLSVPHWGTNIADWVHSHAPLRKLVIAALQTGVAGSRVYLLDVIESHLARDTAALTRAEIFLALQDALTEANPHYGIPSPARTAEAEEAASELDLYLRQMDTDFRVIHDLTSQSHDRRFESPAHWDEATRKDELQLWCDPPIKVLSYVTVGGRPFQFPHDGTVPAWELSNPATLLDVIRDPQVNGKTDVAYRLCYRACAGGPFRSPQGAGDITRVLGRTPPLPLETWDNDGIVNTASMLWPTGARVLVMADHLDIVGHYSLIETPEARKSKRPFEVARQYQAYDFLQSAPRFTGRAFRQVWTEIFEFAVDPKSFLKNEDMQASPPRWRVAAA